MERRFVIMVTLMTAIMMFAVSHTFAQPQGGHRPPHEGMVKELKVKLNLTEEQTKKIEKIFESERQEIKKQRRDAEDKREEEMKTMREKMEKKRKERDEKISAVLTVEQKKKFEELKKEREERFERRIHDGMLDETPEEDFR